METKTQITVETTVNVPVQKVWEVWTNPHHIMKWNNASEDWHTPAAENDLRVGGSFKSTMAAKDGSASFDFGGTYSKVEQHKHIAYTLDDGRQVHVEFADHGAKTKITETFDAENANPIELQRSGWQAIMTNFKKYTESLPKTEKLKFEIQINAPVELVYKNMIDDAHYRTWTAAFNPGSHYQGSWQKGSKILFLGPDKNGNMGGMVARIEENIPNQFISIEHLGIVNAGQEITSGQEVEDWAGAHENYTFKSHNNGTLLTVEMDSSDEFKSMFETIWPKALKTLKDICEK
ncbi:MAG: SRPBCC domain-containing protein [Bacteroidetes bacterium]|nr:SRPBCC domain-containing protein [Bacteroidota bacterium]